MRAPWMEFLFLVRCVFVQVLVKARFKGKKGSQQEVL